VTTVFQELTDELLELRAVRRGHGAALYAQVEIGLCCSLTCTSTSCE
jgi:hypothetical protein